MEKSEKRSTKMEKKKENSTQPAALKAAPARLWESFTRRRGTPVYSSVKKPKSITKPARDLNFIKMGAKKAEERSSRKR